MWSGTDSAHRLFWMMNTAGSFCTAAKLSASWKSPRAVPPSPV